MEQRSKRPHSMYNQQNENESNGEDWGEARRRSAVGWSRPKRKAQRSSTRQCPCLNPKPKRRNEHEENDVRSVLLSLESVLPSGRTRRKLASRGVVLLLLGDLVELFKDGGEGVAVGGRHDGLGGLDGRGRRGARSGSVGGDGRGVGGLGGGRVFGRRGDAKRGAAEGARK
jgi:hypothetical protein